MTYTVHRDTQEVLQILDQLDLDTDIPSQEEIMKRFGYEEAFASGRLSIWQRARTKVWQLFDEPYSSASAKVSSY